MCSIYSVLGFFIAVFVAAIGLLVGLDEPQNTTFEIVSDILKHGAILIAAASGLPEVIRMIM